jgi:hypothetical protein
MAHQITQSQLQDQMLVVRACLRFCYRKRKSLHCLEIIAPVLFLQIDLPLDELAAAHCAALILKIDALMDHSFPVFLEPFSSHPDNLSAGRIPEYSLMYLTGCQW